ncbi:MAG: FkbM family methyltransferase [Chloroflexi bacterium]|nr:FkbM family methyltransferase [Chloroflexota bacterium]
MESSFIPALRLPSAYRVYQRLAQWYVSASPPWPLPIRLLFEWLIRLAAMALAALSGFRFPRKAIGGWWWIWRYRFEMLVGWYEYPTALWIRRLLQPGMVAVDVGAHIGYFTCLFSRLVSPSGKVFAFEPSPDNFLLLRHNLSHRRASNTTFVQAAVADKPGRALLYVSPGHSNHSLVPGYTGSEAAVPVETVSLDQYLSAVGEDRLDLIKIDAEGAEPQILEGMKRILSANPQLAMIIEINPNALSAAGSSPQSLLECLAAQGLVSREILPDGRLADPQNRDFKGGPNLLCLRPEQWRRLSLE